MENIRVKLLLQMYHHKDILKAVALSMYIKVHTTSSLIKDWSVYKICKLTGLSQGTVKKRLHTLFDLGLVKEEGSHLLFGRMKSSCNRNNIDISTIDYTSVKEIEKGLNALLVVLIQRQKDYANLQLQRAHNGKTLKEVKKGMRESKVYGWQGPYVEHGLSYMGIAKKLGVCVKTAFEIVKYGVMRGFFRKVSHFMCFFGSKGASNLDEVPQGFTFISKKGYLYKVTANTYTLSSAFALAGNN